MKAFFLTGSAATSFLPPQWRDRFPGNGGRQNRQFDVARAGGWAAALFGKARWSSAMVIKGVLMVPTTVSQWATP